MLQVKSLQDFTDGFYEDHEVEYEAVVKVDGEVIAKVSAYNSEELCSQTRKLDHKVDEHIQSEYSYEIDDMADRMKDDGWYV